MRRRRIIMFFAMIMTVAMIGVGFAAWIITAPTGPATQEGQITVETVQIQGWTFETYWVNNPTDKVKLVDDEETNNVNEANPIVKFGKPESTVENAWLDNPSIGTENLKVYLYVKANKIEGDNANKDFEIKDTAKVTLSIVKGATETKSSEAKNYTITVPETISNTDLVNGVVITITFNWKTPDLVEKGATQTYNTTNPYAYYNAGGYSDAKSTLAQNYLKALYEELTGAEFVVTLEAGQATK